MRVKDVLDIIIPYLDERQERIHQLKLMQLEMSNKVNGKIISRVISSMFNKGSISSRSEKLNKKWSFDD